MATSLREAPRHRARGRPKGPKASAHKLAVRRDGELPRHPLAAPALLRAETLRFSVKRHAFRLRLPWEGWQEVLRGLYRNRTREPVEHALAPQEPQKAASRLQHGQQLGAGGPRGAHVQVAQLEVRGGGVAQVYPALQREAAAAGVGDAREPAFQRHAVGVHLRHRDEATLSHLAPRAHEAQAGPERWCPPRPGRRRQS